jgi:HEAT repeat protein
LRPGTVKERQLYQEYISFLRGLDPGRIERDYVAAIRDIKSKRRSDRERGLRVLGASGEIDAIAWIVPLIESNDDGLRIRAGLALDAIVSNYEIERRDMSQPEKIVILPRSPSDVDLRALAWLLLKMMRHPDDGGTAAYAAYMAGLLGIYELEGEIEELLKSRHPSVRNSALSALSQLRERT